MSRMSQSKETNGHVAGALGSGLAPGAGRLAGLADIAVHADGSARDEAKIAHAQALAEAADAHLTVFLANHIALTPIPPGPGSEWLMAEIVKQSEKAGGETEEALRRRLPVSDAPTEVRRFDEMLAGLSNAAARIARTSDVFVMGRPYGETRHWPELVDAVLFEADRTVLVVPPEGRFPAVPRSVVIGWRDSAECAAAIDAAMPFLRACDLAILASVSEGGSDEERHREPAADMARHLSRHGVDVEIRHLSDWARPAEALIREAQMTGAEMIVCGAYGRSRLREFILGGVTRDLLSECPVPLLLRH